MTASLISKCEFSRSKSLKFAEAIIDENRKSVNDRALLPLLSPVSVNLNLIVFLVIN